MFQDKDDGIIWKNALYSIWLGYTTKAVESVDEKVTKREVAKGKLMRSHAHSHHDHSIHHDICSCGPHDPEHHLQKEEYTQTLNRDGNPTKLESSEKLKTEENENLIVKEPVETVRQLLNIDENINSDEVLIEMPNKQFKKN